MADVAAMETIAIVGDARLALNRDDSDHGGTSH
jgi:hypothetical protein